MGVLLLGLGEEGIRLRSGVQKRVKKEKLTNGMAMSKT